MDAANQMNTLGIFDSVPMLKISNDELQRFENKKGHAVLVLLEEINVCTRSEQQVDP